jgi:hypothetical protein
MSPTTKNKLALAWALVSFAVLAFGSVATGARVTTALFRGVEAALVFGALAWVLLTWFSSADDSPGASPENAKGVDETV